MLRRSGEKKSQDWARLRRLALACNSPHCVLREVGSCLQSWPGVTNESRLHGSIATAVILSFAHGSLLPKRNLFCRPSQLLALGNLTANFSSALFPHSLSKALSSLLFF